MEKKNYEIREWVKKKLSRSQYFYNIFTINHTWLIIISSKNLWQINCGNGITEKLSRTQYFYNIFIINHTWLIIISSKNLWQINCGNGIAENVKKKIMKSVNE